MPPAAQHRLAEPYRPIRPVSVGPDAPWPGMLVRLPSGESALMVDAADLPEGWHGWDATASGHILGAGDVVRRTEGHGILVPAFSGRLEEFLDRRRDGRVPLTPGEAVTLAVSVVRGIAELGEDARTVTGEWWLTDGGRPVIVTERGDRDAHTASVWVLEEVVAPLGDHAARSLREALSRPRLRDPEVAHLESELFSVASPAPLADTPLAPRPARAAATVGARGADPLAGDPADARPWFEHIARHVDADLADLVSRATTSVWRRMRAPRPAGGRRPWILAVVVAGGVVIAGLLWPGGGPATAEGDVPAPGATATASADTTSVEVADQSAPGATEEPVTTDTDHAAVVSALLTARTDCVGDPACLAAVMIDPTVAFPAGVVDLPREERVSTLLDEFGDVAVVRVDPTTPGAAQLVVIQAEGDRWLLREIFDAQQPA